MLSEHMNALLVDLAEFLEEYADVRDGNEGEQRPNRAMSLLQRVEEYLPQERG